MATFGWLFYCPGSMKKIVLLALMVPAMAFAQTFPSPTFSSITLQTPLAASSGGTGTSTTTGTGSVVLSNSPTLVSPALGTPSAVVLTNGTSLPVSTGVSGLGAGVAAALGNAVTGSGGTVLATSPTIVSPIVTGGFTATGLVTTADFAAVAANSVLANATGSSASPTAFAMPSCNGANNALRWTSGGGFTCASTIALTSGTLAQFAATSSAQLLGVVSDETGSGSLVFGTSPTISSPTISGGTISGAPISGSTGTFTTLSASSTVSGAGFSNYLASPPAIGSTTPAAGTFTTATTSNLQVNTGISVGPTAASLTKDINVSQAVSGTTSANCTTTTLIMYPCANLFYVSSDTANASSAPGPVMDTWQFATNFGGSTLNGGRQIMDVIGHFTGPSNAANPLPGYVAIAGELITNSGDNGTAPTLANGRGSFFAMNPVVVANSGAQNLLGIAGAEVNVQCNGCSTAIRYGVSSVQNGANQASILANDAAFHVGNQVSGGAWHQALNISNANGQAPLDTTGCVICTDSTNNTIGTGIDLSAYNITGNFLSGPSGFHVTGAGALTVPAGAGVAGGLTVSSGGAGITGGLTVSGGTTSVAALTASGSVSGAGFTSLLSPYAPLASPALTGTPTTPAPATGTNNTQIATTSFGHNLLAAPDAIGSLTPNAGTFTTLTGTAVNHSQQERDTSYSFQQPTTGQTVTVSSGTETLLIAPAGALSSLTITLPGCTSGYDGSLVRFVSFQNITSLTVNAPSTTMVAPPTSLTIGAGHAFICRGVATAWYPLY